MKEPNGPNDLRAIAHKAMIDRGLEPDFPPDAIQQVNGIQGPARETDHSIRDLRNCLWCSIDNDTSRDLDQLTVAEKLTAGGVKILVAISDVDALVKPVSPIDRHARTNTTSVYTAAEIFPMLPERLSTNLTSLGEGEDRLALVIDMGVAADGSIQESQVYRALVNNHAKLAYRSVAAWLDGKGEMPEKIARTKGLDEQLRMQDQIAQVMKSVRYLHGALDLETIEPEAVLRDGQIVDLRLERKNRAQELIEDFMIAANGVSAEFLDKHGIPALRRIVRSPERWDAIRKVALGFADDLPVDPDSKALAAFLARRRLADPLRFPDLSLTIVKLLGAGEYVLQLPGQQSAGHFGLAVREYSHSTAPNRRFPDLITQRLLKAALAGDKLPYVPQSRLGKADHHVREARDYLHLCANENKNAVQRFGHIAAAELAEDSAACEPLKILVLGDCPLAEIAARTGLEVTVLETWELLFFDVRAAREATDWVLIRVIGPELKNGNGPLAAKLKYAYAGGPYAARAVLDAESRVSLRQGERLLDQKIRLHIKVQEALDLPMNAANQLRLIKLNAQIIFQERRLDIDERKLAERSQAALMRQKQADRRLELAARREEQRAARKAERQAERARREEQRRWRQRLQQAHVWSQASAREQLRQELRAQADQSLLAQLRWDCSEAYLAQTQTEPTTGGPEWMNQPRSPLEEQPILSGKDVGKRLAEAEAANWTANTNLAPCAA